MRVLYVLALLLPLSGCSRPGPPVVAVAEARVELAELDVERCDGDLKDARDDLKRLSPTAVPEKTLVEAKRKVAEAEHGLKVARAKLKEQNALLEYAKATGRLQ